MLETEVFGNSCYPNLISIQIHIKYFISSLHPQAVVKATLPMRHWCETGDVMLLRTKSQKGGLTWLIFGVIMFTLWSFEREVPSLWGILESSKTISLTCWGLGLLNISGNYELTERQAFGNYCFMWKLAIGTNQQVSCPFLC